MKTLRVGGRRQNLERYKTGTTSVFQAMLKWVLENRNIDSAVTEILTYAQMEEDLSVPGSRLSEEERRMLYGYVVRKTPRITADSCGTCRSRCPSGIDTTGALRCLAYHEGYAEDAIGQGHVLRNRSRQNCRGLPELRGM